VHLRVATEVLARVAAAESGSAWHVATSLLGDEGLLVVGLSRSQLERGLIAERAVWEAAALQLTKVVDVIGSDDGADAERLDCAAAQLELACLEVQLCAEQAALLLTAVQATPARTDRRD